jgi:hypothetical protein
MTRLNDKQTAVLGNAARRPEGHVLPLPEHVQMKGGGLAAMMKAMERRSLVQRSADDSWTITDAGRVVVASEDEPKTKESKDENTGSLAATPEPQADNHHDARAPLFRSGTRHAQVLDLLQRDEGTDIDEIEQLTGRQPHSVRAVLTGFRKRGIEVTRTKEGNGVSVYRATLSASADGMAA